MPGGESGPGPRPPKPEFAEVYASEVFEVYGFLAYRLRSREQAEDLTQATFERALKAWGRFDPRRASPRTWLLAIARNLLVDHHRRGRDRREELVESADRHADAASDLEAGQMPLGLSGELQAALDQLSDRSRELIALRFGAELTGPEIAELTGLSLANVQQILSRALRALRGELAGSEPAIGSPEEARPEDRA